MRSVTHILVGSDRYRSGFFLKPSELLKAPSALVPYVSQRMKSMIASSAPIMEAVKYLCPTPKK